jgi:hypothetical protein
VNNPFWPEEAAAWRVPKNSLSRELDGLMSWAFDPKTKLSRLNLKGWKAFKNKIRRSAGEKGGKGYGREAS